MWNGEWDVLRVRRLRISTEKKGKVLGDDDVHVYSERQFYDGPGKAHGMVADELAG
jgi:hypothetical protein